VHGTLDIFATKARINSRKKSLLNSNISSTCPHNMVNFSLLVAAISSVVWDIAANFQRVSHLGFVTIATSLNGSQPNFAQCLAISWAAIYIYIFGGSCPVTEFCKVQNLLCVQVLLSYIGSITAWHSSSGRQPNFEALSTGRHLYLTGQPSRWALTHVVDELRFYIPLDKKQRRSSQPMFWLVLRNQKAKTGRNNYKNIQ